MGHHAFTYNLFQAVQNNVLAAGLTDVNMVSCCIKSLQKLQTSVPCTGLQMLKAPCSVQSNNTARQEGADIFENGSQVSSSLPLTVE